MKGSEIAIAALTILGMLALAFAVATFASVPLGAIIALLSPLAAIGTVRAEVRGRQAQDAMIDLAQRQREKDEGASGSDPSR